MNGEDSTTRTSGCPIHLDLGSFLNSVDLYFWYNNAFGSPVARAQGIGYVQELLARLTHTPIPVHNSSTNATINDNPVTFPLGQSLYVDATHDTVVLNGEQRPIPPAMT